MPAADGTFRTDDMALATVLALGGFKYEVIKYTERKALWIFSWEDTREEEFDDLVDNYQDFLHMCEVRQFIQRYKELKTEITNKLRSSDRIVPAA
jgi:hypothetical protein